MWILTPIAVVPLVFMLLGAYFLGGSGALIGMVMALAVIFGLVELQRKDILSAIERDRKRKLRESSTPSRQSYSN